MKRIILYLLFLTFEFSFSQKVLDKFELVGTKEIISNKLNTSIYTIYNNKYYYITDSSKTKIIKSIENEFIAKLIFPDNIKIYDSECFALNENYLVVTDWDKIHIFINNNFNFIYKYSFDINYPIESVKIVKKLIYLQGAIIGSNIDLDSHIVAVKIDIEKNDINVLKLKDPEGFGFSFFTPKNIIDFQDTLIYVSNFTKYTIDIYNWEGKFINSFGRTPNKWINSDIEIPKYPKGSNKPGKFINEITPFFKKQSIINKMYFIDTNQIIVGWLLPDTDSTTYNYVFDIWKNNSASKWELVSQDLGDFNSENKSELNYNSFSLGIYFNVVNNYLFTFNVGNKDLFIKSMGSSYNDYKKKLDEFIIDHPLQYILGVYKIKQ